MSLLPQVPIRAHHQRAIDRLTAAYCHDTAYLGLIIGGSVAKGCARDDSDVDFMIVARDDEHERRVKASDVFINRRDLCDYEGGYVDGKVISLDYLERASVSANEPTRAAFEGAFVAFSHLDGLPDLLGRIPVYQETGHEERVRAFYSMAFIQHWLMQEATRHNNAYTIARAASQLALYSGRLILAHNRYLFPYHKWLVRALEHAPQKPAGFMMSFHDLCQRPSAKTAEALFSPLQAFADWGVTDLEAYTWFMTDVEMAWMEGNTTLEDV
ncbi:MAG: nucleotidyltransferase domain-containing protein [Pseudomonadota bacterium]